MRCPLTDKCFFTKITVTLYSQSLDDANKLKNAPPPPNLVVFYVNPFTLATPLTASFFSVFFTLKEKPRCSFLLKEYHGRIPFVVSPFYSNEMQGRARYPSGRVCEQSTAIVSLEIGIVSFSPRTCTQGLLKPPPIPWMFTLYFNSGCLISVRLPQSWFFSMFNPCLVHHSLT